jgi:hypothetical protein
LFGDQAALADDRRLAEIDLDAAGLVDQYDDPQRRQGRCLILRGGVPRREQR